MRDFAYLRLGVLVCAQRTPPAAGRLRRVAMKGHATCWMSWCAHGAHHPLLIGHGGRHSEGGEGPRLAQARRGRERSRRQPRQVGQQWDRLERHLLPGQPHHLQPRARWRSLRRRLLLWRHHCPLRREIAHVSNLHNTCMTPHLQELLLLRSYHSPLRLKPSN